MEQVKEHFSFGNHRKDDIFLDIKKVFGKILKYWYFIFLSVAACVVVAFFVNRYTHPVYLVNTSVLMKGQKNEGITLSDIFSLQGRSSGGSNLKDEAVLLTSYKLIKSTLKNLNFGISYFIEDNYLLKELYQHTPVTLTLYKTSTNIPYGKQFACKILNRESFQLIDEDKVQNFKFGRTIDIEGFIFKIDLNENAEKYIGNQIIFQVNNIEQLVKHYRNSLSINPISEKSSVLNISITGTNPAKEMDFLNALVKNYIDKDKDEKNYNSKRTIEFIDQQLAKNSDSLRTIEGRMQDFRDQNATLNLSTEGNQLFKDIQELEKQKSSIELAQQYYDYLENSLSSQEGKLEQVEVPASIGLQDPVLNSLVKKLVDTQIEVKSIADDPNELKHNPRVQSKLQTIEELKVNILSNIKNVTATNRITLNDLSRRIGLFNSSLQRLPKAEREYINIQRNYSLSENLYMLLMQKKTEAGIAAASVESDFKVINSAELVGGALKPRPIKNYITAVIVGLVVPIGIILIVYLLNDKVTSKEDVLRLTSIPVIGSIVSAKNAADIFERKAKPNSALSESFRSIRTKLQYLVSSKGDQAKVILLTSSISGEGKTFCSKYLAYLLSITNKRVVLINSDLRKPNVSREYGSIGAGLSSYLAGLNDIQEIINRSPYDNLYLIKSGEIPPNPGELLLSKRMEDLLTYLKSNFDYIILDSAPIGIVSDGLELMKFADANILLVRQNYSLKSYVHEFNELYHSGRYQHIVVMMNDVKSKKLQYGYGYYAEDKKSKKVKKQLEKLKEQKDQLVTTKES
ncbi:polysaccharide biosynthesis tyrosine autokinase [Rapidithrix thailandica]|uniref:non-specific protein-tyrosine kinase n=1 Tax=Rapidithrix thailandica TaxID=413964 RepID=A0AAW9S8E7_9BACT